jgi:hypothetical protein
MQVEDGLACAGADVEDRAVSLLDFALARNLRGGEMASADHLGVRRFRFFQAGEMFLGNDEYVRGRLRLDIFEGKDVVVFVNLLCGNFTANDATEKAIGIAHLFHLPER